VVWWSIALAGAATLFVGGAVGHFTRRGIGYSAIRALIIMAVASAVTFGVGAAVGH
jgi:VIT1/CCC1 family predicted Fe2+/Mn2+ transporter